MPQALARLSLDENHAGFEQACSPDEQPTQTRDDPYQVTGLFVV